jgi:hypothetical protein
LFHATTQNFKTKLTAEAMCYLNYLKNNLF